MEQPDLWIPLPLFQELCQILDGHTAVARFPKIAQLKTIEAFRDRMVELEIDLPIDEAIQTAAEGSPLAGSLEIGGRIVGNRWCIHPMEGWDANPDGSPTEHTLRRWHNFGLSGAKLIWGGEAAAVQRNGRANPGQILAVQENREGLAQLLRVTLNAHREAFDTIDDLLVGLQLTHSGRYSRPNSSHLEPRIAYHHPLLDEKCGIDPDDPTMIVSDEDVHQLIDDFVAAAGMAQEIGFQFVDIKSCHGYLLHEFLSATPRTGEFGGNFDGRTKLLTTIIRRVRKSYPDLIVGVRLSVFDTLPYVAGQEVGEPMKYDHLLPYSLGFGVEANDPQQYDLTESIQLIRQLRNLGVAMINVSCGSPYANPHIQRPAAFPPSDGYLPPEDPLVGVARQIHAAYELKQAVPEMPLIGSGYTYLQDYLPHVAQAVVRQGWIDFVGLGRMVLSYPELPADILSSGQMKRKQICRTFSDCTTGPRNGLISGCYPLDSHYRNLPEAEQVKAIKQQMRTDS